MAQGMKERKEILWNYSSGVQELISFSKVKVTGDILKFLQNFSFIVKKFGTRV